MALNSRDPAVRAMIARASKGIEPGKARQAAAEAGKQLAVAAAVRGMNKGESHYRDYLERLAMAGEVRLFRFEAVRLRLAYRDTYLPDFLVVLPDWRVELHEVKGRKGESFYCKEDAWEKLKVAAALYPWWQFLVVWPVEGGAWRRQEIIP